MAKKKVLLLQGILSNYRRETYEKIAEVFDLTVAYSEKNEIKEIPSFKVIKLNPWRIKSLFIQRPGFFKFCAQFDAVIFLSDLHHVSYCMLPFIPRKFKVIPWTIGIRASYTRPYDLDRKHDFVDSIYGKILSKSDAVIFYMRNALAFWRGRLDERKVFEAHNTVPVSQLEIDEAVKKNILFVGTLYKQKNIDLLIRLYAESAARGDNAPELDIIGKGPERENLEALAKELGVENKVHFYGAIYDEAMLKNFFAKALICVSPDQAGLSVIKSMGYGVPYVTRRNAITGGEILNIHDGIDGVLYDSDDDLKKILSSLTTSRGRLLEMGKNARKFYNEHATTAIMAQGAIDAVNYALEK